MLKTESHDRPQRVPDFRSAKQKKQPPQGVNALGQIENLHPLYVELVCGDPAHRKSMGDSLVPHASEYIFGEETAFEK